MKLQDSSFHIHVSWSRAVHIIRFSCKSFEGLTVICIYTLSDLGVLSKLIVSVHESLANGSE